LKIHNRTIGRNSPVFVIAEAGVNHNNKLALAYKMVDIAAKAGADAIKFQTFVADKIQLPNSVKPNYQKNIKGKSYAKLMKELEPSFEDQIKLFNYCRKKKIIFLSTPYDKESVDFLDNLEISAFKISSSDTTNHLFLGYVAKKKKPIILSTGLSSFKHVVLAFNLLKKLKMENKLILLQTTSDYPTPYDEVNLRVIPKYSKKFGVPVGLSDHTLDYTSTLGAIALGACVVEKHFTLNKKLKGPDQSSSLVPYQLKEWINKIRILEQSLGRSKKIITKSEKGNLTMRKIIVIKPAQKGTILTKVSLETMRGSKRGILPLTQNINKIVGKKLIKKIDVPTEFSWKLISKQF